MISYKINLQDKFRCFSSYNSKRKIIQMEKNSHYQRSVRSNQCAPSCFVVHGNIHSVQMKVEPSHLRTCKPVHIPHTNNLYYTQHDIPHVTAGDSQTCFRPAETLVNFYRSSCLEIVDTACLMICFRLSSLSLCVCVCVCV